MLNEVIEIIKETFSPSIEVTGDAAIKKRFRTGFIRYCQSHMYIGRKV